MKIRTEHIDTIYTADLSNPIDISIPLNPGSQNPNCFGASDPIFEPVRTASFTGDTREGGAVNFYTIQINPHGNGTHTECVGHISKERFFIRDCMKDFHGIGFLVSVTPEKQNDDLVISKKILETALAASRTNTSVLLIRTRPNGSDKLTRNYTGTNPVYFTPDAMQYLLDLEVEHLIVDLPSVDREQDGGKLAAHHIFWNYPAAPRMQASITELVYIPDTVADGLYLVNLQVLPIALDASCSRILLYSLL
jgi:kynurenine formamidase